VLAATVRVTRDLDLAEECTQDAYTHALSSWATGGIPDRPGAWLTTVARNRALDALRRAAALRRTLPLLAMEEPVAGPAEDDLLRLIFTCCHPALSADAQVALTLRLLCGLSTAEVARAFLVPHATMAARITRAKKKITAARIPYRVPGADELGERLGAVLAVLHLVFSTGHTAPIGATLARRDLVHAALDLTRMLHRRLPGHAEVAGLLALLLLTDARRDTRVGADGGLVLLAEQDRSRWDAGQIAEGSALLAEALGAVPPSRYAVQAAIAAVHAEAPTWAETDFAEIVGLYDVLRELWPSPVVELNRAVAVGMAFGPATGLELVDELVVEGSLPGYHLLSSVRGDLLAKLGRRDEARAEFELAASMTRNTRERKMLLERAADCA
jgi:RNA polymerase sigma-70 factor (ECF subfamily)